MSNYNEKSCVGIPPSKRNCATLECKSATTYATTSATTNLKALANKVLERNFVRNSCATRIINERNFSAINESKKLRPMKTYSCFKLYELREAAGVDWDGIKDKPEMLAVFASALRDITMRSMALIPDHYTKCVHCMCCGKVKLWESCPEVVHGCPWCLTKRNNYE